MVITVFHRSLFCIVLRLLEVIIMTGGCVSISNSGNSMSPPVDRSRRNMLLLSSTNCFERQLNLPGKIVVVLLTPFLTSDFQSAFLI